MNVIETIYDLPSERIVLGKDDWDNNDWEFILNLFGVKNVDRIVVCDYRTEVFEGRDPSCQE